MFLGVCVREGMGVDWAESLCRHREPSAHTDPANGCQSNVPIQLMHVRPKPYQLMRRVQRNRERQPTNMIEPCVLPLHPELTMTGWLVGPEEVIIRFF